jgi:hypothetical protein
MTELPRPNGQIFKLLFLSELYLVYRFRKKNIDWGLNWSIFQGNFHVIHWEGLNSGCSGKYLDLTDRKNQKDRNNYMLSSFIICTFHQLLLG